MLLNKCGVIRGELDISGTLADGVVAAGNTVMAGDFVKIISESGGVRYIAVATGSDTIYGIAKHGGDAGQTVRVVTP